MRLWKWYRNLNWTLAVLVAHVALVASVLILAGSVNMFMDSKREHSSYVEGLDFHTLKQIERTLKHRSDGWSRMRLEAVREEIGRRAK